MALYGEWRNAGITLENLYRKSNKTATKKMVNASEKIKDIIVGHIDSQDLDWTPLSHNTVRIKGNDTIYKDTSYLRNNIKVRKLKSKADSESYFIGANPWTRHPKGLQLSDLMNILEYGNSKIPPRPLIRPSYKEAQTLMAKLVVDMTDDLRKLVIK